MAGYPATPDYPAGFFILPDIRLDYSAESKILPDYPAEYPAYLAGSGGTGYLASGKKYQIRPNPNFVLIKDLTAFLNDIYTYSKFKSTL